MAFASWQATIVDGAGNVVPNAAITVQRELPGLPPAACFADKAGTTPLGGAFNADAVTGFVRFYAAGGFFRIVATSGAFSREWRDVAIGTAAGTDAGVLPVAVPPTWLFDNATADADPGAGEFRLNNANPALATAAYVDNLAAGGVDVSAWLNTLDDSGDSALRGVLTIFDPNNPTTVFRTYAVSGSVVDGTGYRKLTLAPIAGAGSFTPGTAYQMTFSARGPAGVGDVTGPAGAAAGHAAIFSGTTGKVITSAGAGPMLQGKHTIWVPASAMMLRTAGSPAPGKFTAGSTSFDYLAFDPTTNEDALFNVAMPKNWNEGAVSFQVYWMHPATVTNFGTVWAGFVKAYSNDDAIDGAAFTTIGEVTDTGGTTNDLYIADESASATPGAAAENDLLNFIIRRVPTNGNDTLAVDAFLIGVKIFYSINAGNDA